MTTAAQAKTDFVTRDRTRDLLRQTRPDQTRPEPFQYLTQAFRTLTSFIRLSLLNARARKDGSKDGRSADALDELTDAEYDSMPWPYGMDEHDWTPAVVDWVEELLADRLARAASGITREGNANAEA